MATRHQGRSLYKIDRRRLHLEVPPNGRTVRGHRHDRAARVRRGLRGCDGARVGRCSTHDRVLVGGGEGGRRLLCVWIRTREWSLMKGKLAQGGMVRAGAGETEGNMLVDVGEGGWSTREGWRAEKQFAGVASIYRRKERPDGTRNSVAARRDDDVRLPVGKSDGSADMSELSEVVPRASKSEGEEDRTRTGTRTGTRTSTRTGTWTDASGRGEHQIPE